MTLVYDAMNRLVETSGHGSDLVALYDASGTRVKRTLDDVTTFYIGEDYEIKTGPPVDEDTIGLWDTATWQFLLSNDLSSASSDVIANPYGANGDIALAGDWDGDGIDGIGILRPSTRIWYLKEHATNPSTDHGFSYSAAGDIPVAGDWDGDGIDTIGVYRPSNRVFYFRNDFAGGAAEFNSGGYGSAGDVPIVGDWDGDGIDTIGLYRPSNGSFYLRNDFYGGAAQWTVGGVGSAGDVPVVGDWDGDGVDTVGLYRPSVSKFFLKNSHTGGAVFDVVTDVWGAGSELPVAGNWNGTIGHDGEQVTVNYSVAGMSVGSTINGELWVGVSDHLGSGSVVRDSDGDTRVQRYTPFGAVRAPGLESGLPTDEGFTGQTADRGLGLIDYNARAYDPQLGRFVMADTVLDGLNRYSYVRNNPLRYTDPSGHCIGGYGCPFDEIGDAIGDVAVGAKDAAEDAFGDLTHPWRIPVNIYSSYSALARACRGGDHIACFEMLEFGGNVRNFRHNFQRLKDLRNGDFEAVAHGLGYDAFNVATVVAGPGAWARVVSATSRVSILRRLPKRAPGATHLDDVPGLSGFNRTGSALKTDAQHAFPDIVDNFATEGSRFSIPTKGPGGVVVRESDLFQIGGSLNGRSGVFEWIIDAGEMTHRRFIPGGTITGYPNQVPG